MEKIIVYGIGEYYRKNKHKLPPDVEIVAYADSNINNTTSVTGKLYEGKEIITPAEFKNVDYDYIYICTSYTAGNRILQNLRENNLDIRKIKLLNRIGTLDGGIEWHYQVENEDSFISTIGNIRIREKYLTDFDIVVEVFVNQAYHINLLQENVTVIDVGMNIGAVSLYFAEKDWVNKVYGFEPFPDTYQQALENFALNNDIIKSKIHPMNVALSDKAGEMEVAVVTENTGWRSINTVQTSDTRKEKIYCKTAADEIGKIIEENSGSKVILKVDTEGSEFAIFNSLRQTDLLNHIDAVLLEYHRDPEEITDLLKRHQFKYFVTGQKIGMIYAVK
ncbi:MAG: FkbM family methyltransferase [Bacillus sp. (in: Bacteria)]|nr:FkbM family methyltransferase [Bacillus sp. (in: firmicutes)]MCM1425836.1 FkbM family methyltransferase [Eubacterium sp.]